MWVLPSVVLRSYYVREAGQLFSPKGQTGRRRGLRRAAAAGGDVGFGPEPGGSGPALRGT